MSRSLRFLTAALLVLGTGSLAQAAAIIVVERRFPVGFYCPIDNDDFNLTFVAEGPFARITFDASNYFNGSWLHRRLDNIGIEAKSVYDANKVVTFGFDSCYVSPGHSDTPGYDFLGGAPEIYLNLFDANADGWDLNRLAYFEPGPGVSAPREPADTSPPLDTSGGALGLGKIGDGAVNVSTSILVSGLTAGTQYILTGWWYMADEIQPMTVTIDTAPCLDRDFDGVGDCTDCDDRNPKRKPGATEVCDGVDNDCDGLIDESTPCDRVCDVPSKVGGSDLRVTNAVFTSDNPSLVWNGTDFAMFYKDSRNGGQEMFFSRVSAAGAKIGSDVNVLPGAQSVKPRAVWTGSEYGVVWEEGDVVAFRRFDRNGVPIGSEVLLGASSPGAFSPDIAWTGKEYGIVWAQYVLTPEIFFTRLAPDATSLMSPVQISNLQSPQDPKVAWNGTHYGVVWQGFSSTQTIFFRRVAPLDVKNGTILELTPGGAGSFSPAIAAGGTDWGVVFSDFRNGSDSEIYFARVNAAGAKVGTDTRVTNATGASIAPSIAWSGSEWGITCEDYRAAATSDQWFGRVTAAGAKTGTDFRVTTAAGTSQQGSVVWAGGKYAIAWNDDRDAGEQEIYFARVGCDCVDGDADTFSSCVDCDDGRAATFPGGSQVCDGFNNNCSDVNWPLLTGTNEVDADNDGFTLCLGDCNDSNNGVWATPGEARFVLLSHDKLNNVTNLSWSAPTALGGTAASITYDTVRSGTASNFVSGATCVETNNGPNTVSTDTSAPASGARFFYLIRGENACPSGQGSLGNASNGTPRTARTCP